MFILVGEDQDFIQEPPIQVEVEATGVTIQALNAENLPEKEEESDVPKHVRIKIRLATKPFLLILSLDVKLITSMIAGKRF